MTNPSSARQLRGRATMIVLLTVSLVAGPITGVGDAEAQDPGSAVCAPPGVIDASGRSIDPRPRNVVQTFGWGPVCELEQEVIAEIAAERGLALSAAVHDQIVSYGRDEVRIRLFERLVEVALRNEAIRTPVESGAIDWFDDLLRETQVSVPQKALEEYDRWKEEPCAYDPPGNFEYAAQSTVCGSGSSLANLFWGDPRPPTYAEFAMYGLGAHIDRLDDADARGDAYQLAATLGGAIGAGIVTSLVLAKAVGPRLLTRLLLPAVRAAGQVARGIWVTGAIALVVVAVAIEVIVRTSEFIEDAAIPVQLQNDLIIAQAPRAERTREIMLDPDLQGLAFLAFYDATLPGHDPIPTAVPDDQPGVDAAWFRHDPASSSGLAPSYSQTLRYLDPVEGLQVAWLADTWFVTRALDGTGPPRLTPQLTAQTPRGPAIIRYDGTEFMTQVMPMTNAETDLTCPGPMCTVEDRLVYAMDTGSGTGTGTLVTSVSTLSRSRPTGATITRIDSEPTDEDRELRFRGTGSDPEGDPVTYVWDILRDGEVIHTVPDGDNHEIGFVFAEPGDYGVRLRVTDPTGLYAEANLNDLVIAPVVEPIEVRTLWFDDFISAYREGPLFEGQGTGLISVLGGPGDEVSIDLDLDGLRDVWGVIDEGATSIELPSGSYPDEGSHPVFVDIIREGNLDKRVSDTVYVQVINDTPTQVTRVFEVTESNGAFNLKAEIPPEPSIGAPSSYEIPEGGWVLASIEVTDPGDDVLNVLAYWADGTVEQRFDVGDGEPGGIFHRFLDDQQAPPLGPFVSSQGLTILAYDDDGAISGCCDWRYWIDVVNVAPEVTDLEVSSSGAIATATFTVSDASPGDVESVLVDWGDGSEPVDLLALSEGEEAYEGAQWDELALEATHDYSAAGEYVVTVTAIDDHPEDATSVQQVVTTSGPAPFVEGLERGAARPQGEASDIEAVLTDPDHDVSELTLIVDWGDGVVTEHPYDHSSGNHPAEHVYTGSGEFEILVSAEDPVGNMSEVATLIAFVENVAPVVELDPVAATVAEGSPLAVTGTLVSPDLGTVTIDWGDSSASEVVDPDDHTGDFAATHTYADDSAPTITVTPIDGTDLAGEAKAVTVTVINVAPSVTDLTATDGLLPFETVTASVSYTDPGADTHAVVIDWGDGSSSTGDTAEHSYELPGRYVVAAMVTDDDGGVGSASRTITVVALEDAVAAVVEALKEVTPTSPKASRKTITKAIRELDGPGQGDAIGALRAGDADEAAHKLSKAIDLLLQARDSGALVDDEIDMLTRILRSLMAGLSGDAGQTDLVADPARSASPQVDPTLPATGATQLTVLLAILAFAATGVLRIPARCRQRRGAASAP